MAATAGSARVWGAGLGVVVLWASAFPAIRVAAPELGVVGLSFVRLAVAASALLAVAPVFGVRRPAPRDLPLILACGLTGMTAYQLLLNQGELSVPAGTASIIVASAPLVSVGVAAVALGERLTPARLVGSAVAVAGVALVCLSRSGLGLSGDVAVVIGAAVVQGVYHPLTRPLLRAYTGLEVATYAMVAGTVTTAPLLLPGAGALASATAGAWAAGVYLALLPSALGFVLWGYAVARLPVAAATSLLYLVPAVALLIAFAWLGEVPLPTELLGGAVVVLGVLCLAQGDRLLRRWPGRRSVHLPAAPSWRLRLALVAVLLIGAFEGCWAWLGGQHDPLTQRASGPYEAWQVVGCTLTLTGLALVAGALLCRGVALAVLPAACTAAWSVPAADGDPTGLWGVGALLILLGALVGTFAVASTGQALRGRWDDRRAGATPT